MSEQALPERMRKIALDLPVPDDMTNREYWLRTEILEWADALEAKLSKMEGIKTFVIDSAEFDDDGNSINDAGQLLDEIYGPDWEALAGGEEA